MDNSNIYSNSASDDLHTMMLDDYDKCLHIGTSSIIGRRSEQQDAIRADTYYSFIENGKAIAVLCDGMGGLTGGEKASALCSSIVFDTFHKYDNIPSIPMFYKSAIAYSDDEVRNLKAEDGTSILNAGTTLVSVAIEDNDLYWASVGDSHIYIIRDNEIICVTTDHNYLMLLNERVKRGEITKEEAENNPKKEALVSYIGVGGVRYIDINNKPFKLTDGDYVVLCSDGLYRSVTETEIKQVVTKHGKETQIAAEALTSLALSKNLKHQDNTSVIVIQFQDSG